jgi:anti-sigma B factor antagonist
MTDPSHLPSVRGFSFAQTELAPGRTRLEVAGELDLAAATQLQKAMAKVDASAELVISFEQCEFIDSSGIAVLILDYNRRAAGGGRLAVYGLSDQVQRVFSMMGLEANGLVFESEKRALAG